MSGPSRVDVIVLLPLAIFRLGYAIAHSREARCISMLSLAYPPEGGGRVPFLVHPMLA